jgi:acetyl esterase/lipase
MSGTWLSGRETSSSAIRPSAAIDDCRRTSAKALSVNELADRDLAYNASQKLDLYRVEAPGRPLVVCIHGGGFISGSRKDERCRQAAAIVNAAGFNCASVGYSLAPADDRFSCWPRNLFDIADALVWLHRNADRLGYSFERLGLFGFSAGCCLANLYIQGGERIFGHLGYGTPVYPVAALVGFYGPYDFPSRQAGRKSPNARLNRDHSPSSWIRQDRTRHRPPVLHVQGDQDDIVYPDQHLRFEADCQELGIPFQAIMARGFGHSFAPRDRNGAGEEIDLGPAVAEFLDRYLAG